MSDERETLFDARERAERTLYGTLPYEESWYETARALLEALDLLAEAYPGESPTNRWRMRVEALGAWPVKA